MKKYRYLPHTNPWHSGVYYSIEEKRLFGWYIIATTLSEPEAKATTDKLNANLST